MAMRRLSWTAGPGALFARHPAVYWVVDSGKFERAFGWQATPLPDAVRATAAWFTERH